MRSISGFVSSLFGSVISAESANVRKYEPVSRGTSWEALPVDGNGVHQFAPECARLPVEIIAAGHERCQTAGSIGDLLEQWAVDVIANPDAEHFGVAWAFADQAQHGGARALFRQAVAQHQNIGHAIRIAAAVGCLHCWLKCGTPLG